MFSHALAVGGLSMTWKEGKCVSETRPARLRGIVFERCQPVFIGQLQPSTHADKLSDRGRGDSWPDKGDRGLERVGQGHQERSQHQS
jgi:hypothetical protein